MPVMYVDRISPVVSIYFDLFYRPWNQSTSSQVPIATLDLDDLDQSPG